MQLFLSQLLLAALALAAPMADETVMATAGGNAWQYGTGGGILGLIVLILDIIVFGACTSPCLDLRPSRSGSDPQLTVVSPCSRSHQVEPSSLPQAALVTPGLHLPYRWSDHLLAVLQPGRPQQRIRLRGAALNKSGALQRR